MLPEAPRSKANNITGVAGACLAEEIDLIGAFTTAAATVRGVSTSIRGRASECGAAEPWLMSAGRAALGEAVDRAK